MTTTLQTKTGKVKFITQKYDVGLYLAIYEEGKAIPAQTGLDMDEIPFHIKIRKGIRKGNTLVLEESTAI